jgi:hypothetical protein
MPTNIQESRQRSSSTFNSCLVSIHPCPRSIFTSSSVSLSPLSRGLEHQTQRPTPVTPIPLLMLRYPLYRPPILPTTVTLSLYPSTDTRHLMPYPLQCSTSYTVDPKPQVPLNPTPLALQSIPHPCTRKPNSKHHRPSASALHLWRILPTRILGLLRTL